MKNFYLFSNVIIVVSLVLLSDLVLAQTYSAGVNAGTGGSANTFVGTNAGQVTTGSNNSMFGFNAGQSNTTGANNTFIGISAGVDNTIETNNTFVGLSTGYINGSFNTFLGSVSGYLSEGNYNSFVGWESGHNNKGSKNTFVGVHSGYSNLGDYNAFFGDSAGYGNGSGNLNAFFGFHSGASNTNGSSNTFMGAKAGLQNTNSGNNAFFGANAGTVSTGADNCFLGSNSGQTNSTGFENVFVGRSSGQANTLGAKNSAVGRSAGSNNITGNRNTFLGYSANVPTSPILSNATAVGALAYVSSSNSLVLGAINGLNGATASTNVGIGISAPAYLLHVNGIAAKPGGGSWTVASDNRLKKDVSDFTDGLSVVDKIRPVVFKYNGKAGMPTQKEYVGVIAQEIQKIAPYTVGTFQYADTSGNVEEYLDYDANAITYVLINAVKELKAQNQDLLKLVNQLLSNQSNNLGAASTHVNAKLAAGNSLGDSYPNPNNSVVHIPYCIANTSGSAFIKIYSVVGEEVYSVALSNFGNSEISTDVSSFTSGIYVYRLLVDGRAVDSKTLQVSK